MKPFTCTEKTLKFSHPDTGELVIMVEGDVKSLPDALAADFCGKGWGTAPDCETGERKPGVVVIAPPKTTASKVNLPLAGDTKNT